MRVIIMSYCHLCHNLEGARQPVEVLKDHHNLQSFMTYKSVTGQQASWCEMLSCYNLNIVYRAGKKNYADAPSCLPDYGKALEGPVGAPEGICTTTVLTA